MDTVDDLLRGLRARFDALVSGRDNWDELQTWLADHVDAVDRSGSTQLNEIYNTAWAMLAEYQSGYLPWADFVDAIRELLTRLDARQPAA